MSNSNNSSGTVEISKALIGCGGVVLAAIISGIFLLINTGVIQIGLPTSTQSNAPESSIASPSVQQPNSQAPSVKGRAEMLEVYDAVYKQDGWCGLWDRLVRDGLVDGNCPSSVNQVVRESVVTDLGNNIELITGAQIVITSDTKINYPACINYGIDGDYATLSGGTIREWTSNSNVATDAIVRANSIFSLYFRCDHIAWR